MPVWDKGHRGRGSQECQTEIEMNKIFKVLGFWKSYYLNRPSSPWSAMIYLTSKCNLNCSMCWRHTDFGRKYVNEPELTTPKFKEIITELSEMGCGKLSFAGGGEPLIHKDFLELAGLAKGFGMECDVGTNGTLLLDMVPRLEDIGWDSVSISLDGYIKGINNEIRGRGFDEACSALAAAAKSDIAVNIISVLHPLNYDYLNEMVEFANLNEVRTLNFQPYMELNRKIKEKMKKELPAILKSALERSKELGVSTNLQKMLDYGFSRQAPATNCVMPWIQIHIDDKGSVRPCC